MGQSSAPAAAKRVVHTSLIDAEWDLQQPPAVASEAGPSSSNTLRQREAIDALPARTTFIDTEWDLAPESRIAHRSGEHRIDAVPPRTSLIDSEWDAPLSSEARPEPLRAHVRPRQLALVDTEDDIDPVITWFELEGPECLGLVEGEID